MMTIFVVLNLAKRYCIPLDKKIEVSLYAAGTNGTTANLVAKDVLTLEN
jgi:D-alanyl-D-alanine carboxypeptidase